MIPEIKGLDLWFENFEIPIEKHNVLEYTVATFCSFIYDKDDNREYLSYIDMNDGEEYEEEVDSFFISSLPKKINDGIIEEADYLIFKQLINKETVTI